LSDSGNHRNKKKYRWGELNAQWVEPDVCDNIVKFTKMMTNKTNTPENKLPGMIGITSSKYYYWIDRFGKKNKNGQLE
jgi:hypothetical protein